MASGTMNTTYERISQGAEYVENNRGFLSHVSLPRAGRFLDLACGMGTVTRLLLEAAPDVFLNGIDGDPVQIELGGRELQKLGYTVRHGFDLTTDRVNGKPVVMLAVGPGDEMPFPDNTFDCVTIANAIHMMPDKREFVRQAYRVLKPGGLFGFNSGFYTGSYPPGTERHFLVWVREALAYVEQKNRKLEAEGKPLIKRVHGTTRRAFQNQWFSPEQWCGILEEFHFTPRHVNERLGYLDVVALEALGSYRGIAEVAMSGYPVDEAAEALRETAGASLKAMDLPAMPRKWLEIWATKN